MNVNDYFEGGATPDLLIDGRPAERATLMVPILTAYNLDDPATQEALYALAMEGIDEFAQQRSMQFVPGTLRELPEKREKHESGQHLLYFEAYFA